jgi:hypothetical protein
MWSEMDEEFPSDTPEGQVRMMSPTLMSEVNSTL